MKVGIKGIIVGGIIDIDLTDFLGYDIGVAITGKEEKNITLIITEGYGEMTMSQKTFNLLKKFEGRKASMNGSTQIRAGVIRPEIIIPREDISKTYFIIEDTDKNLGLNIGTLIRVIREPYFGRLGQISQLIVEPQIIETGSKTRVVEVKLENGKRIIVPRANVEMIDWELEK